MLLAKGVRTGAWTAVGLVAAGMSLSWTISSMGPLINDITTDTADPPAFEAVVPLQPEGGNPVEYGGAAVAARQAELYPDIQPLRSALGPDAAFERALEVARAMGWEIIAAGNRRGLIEAVDTTRFLRFKDDIVIRVTASSGGSIIDLRSRSRVGRSDLGKNAARIRDYMARFAR